jgi:uncharacterized membrane protein YadS
VILLDVFSLGFGCMLTYLIWFSVTVPESAPKSKHVPWFIIGFIGVLALACWLAFFRNLLGTPWSQKRPDHQRQYVPVAHGATL